MRIELNEHSYDIILQAGCITNLGAYTNLDRKVLIVTDCGVPEPYIKCVLKQCPQGYLQIMDQGEVSKSMAAFIHLCKRMQYYGFCRTDLIIALGGGVMGDLAGFVAASYMRGIDFVNIPTTLLAQIDSSIGGKCAINLEGVKNVIGAFHQPKRVLIDSDVLQTLPKRQQNNGLVEAIKAGLICDPVLFALLEQPQLQMDEIVRRSLQVKKSVVEQDEKDCGLRQILNFGHTIGHALECCKLGGHEGLLHGEAVAIGMLPMLEEPSVYKRTLEIYRRLGIQATVVYDEQEVYRKIKADKKVRAGKITIVKVGQIGCAKLQRVDIEEIKSYL